MCGQCVRDKYLFDKINYADSGEHIVVDDDVTLFNKGFAPHKWKTNDPVKSRRNNHIELPSKAKLEAELKTENKIYVGQLKDYFYNRYGIYIDNCPELQTLMWKVILRDSEDHRLREKIAQIKSPARYKPKLRDELKKLRKKHREIWSNPNQLDELIYCLSFVFIPDKNIGIKEWRKKPRACKRHPRLSNNPCEPDWHDITAYLRYLSFYHYTKKSESYLRQSLGSSDTLAGITEAFTTTENVRNRYRYHVKKYPNQTPPPEIKQLIARL